MSDQSNTGGAANAERAQTDFEADLKRNIEQLTNLARRNYLFTFACYVVAIVTSVVATLAASVDWLPKPALSFVTALPAVVLLATTALSLEAKSDWYWRKVRFYEGLLSRLRFEGEALVGASKEKRCYDDEVEKTYPKFGVLPTRQS